MAKQSMSLTKLARRIGDDEAEAYIYMEELRWPDGPICPHCGNTKAYFLKPKTGTRATGQKGARSARRVWKCASCRKQFSVLTGTIFHGSKIPLSKWLMVCYEMIASKNGVSAREIERKYEVDTKTAWFMLHRIREAMRRDPARPFMRGTIVADETWIGGAARNRHGGTRRVNDRPGKVIYQRDELKTPVLTLINNESGESRSRVIPNVTGKTLRAALAENVDMAASVLHTDELSGYLPVGREFADHKRVHHSRGIYVNNGATSNQAENFFSQLKRSLDGTHHHVSAEHLPRYLAEFDFRYSTRQLDDATRMERLMAQTGGRRLAYQPLTNT